MTAFTLRIGLKSAVVAGDTLSYAVDKRPLGYMNKLFPLPHVKSVLIFRGQVQPTIDAWSALTWMLDLTSIEQIGERLPKILRDISITYCRNAGIRDYRTVAMLEIAVIGWSAKDKAIRMCEFLNVDGYVAQWVPLGARGISHFPAIPADAMPKGIESKSADAQLVDNVIAMGKWLHDNHGIPVGGEVVACEISARGLDTRILHRFADYEVVKRDGAAIYGRFLRGDYDRNMVKNALVPVDDAQRLTKRSAA